MSYPQSKYFALWILCYYTNTTYQIENLKFLFQGSSAKFFQVDGQIYMNMVYYKKHFGFAGLIRLLIVYGKRGHMQNETKTQWHPAFYSAMRLELADDAEHLNFSNEYNLNTKPLQMDLLIIKKNQGIELKNEIGKIFRKHNIVEYKSPDDSMNVNTYLKVVAYAFLYKTQEEHVGDIDLRDITLTLVREQKPQELFRWFYENGFHIRKKYPGIFYVEKEDWFPIQIIVSCELSKTNQKWLTLLSRRLERTDAERALVQLHTLSEDMKEKFGSAVVFVAEKANKMLFEEVKEDPKMCEFIRQFMAKEIEEEASKLAPQLAKELATELAEEKLANAREQARSEGRDLGVAQMRREISINLIKEGNSIDDISRIMMIPQEKVRELLGVKA